jgi:hypothetical protein
MLKVLRSEVGMFNQLGNWWRSVNDGADAAEVLIEKDMAYVSDETLHELAARSGTPDPATFVGSAREDLDSYHTREQVKANGSVWEKFNYGVLVNEDEHPILSKFLPF